jgi:hypothetical protein
MGVNAVTVAKWASGALGVSDKSEALIIALCVGRARANLSEALKVRREVEKLRKKRDNRASIDTPTIAKPKRSWWEARSLLQPPPKPAKQKRRRMFGWKKPLTKRPPTAKQLAYWRSEAIREHGRKGLAVAAERRRSTQTLPERLGEPLAYASEMCGSPGDSAQKTVDPKSSADAPVEDKT